MIDRLSTWGESHSRRRGETLQYSSSVNKQATRRFAGSCRGDAVLAVAALSPRRWPEPQINRALPHDRGVSFGTVTLHKAPQKWGVHWGPPPLPQESPNNLCDCNTLPTTPPACAPLPWNSQERLRSSWFNYHDLLFPLFPFKVCHTYPVAPLVCKLVKTWASLKYCYKVSDVIQYVKSSAKEFRKCCRTVQLGHLSQINNWKIL